MNRILKLNIISIWCWVCIWNLLYFWSQSEERFWASLLSDWLTSKTEMTWLLKPWRCTVSGPEAEVFFFIDTYICTYGDGSWVWRCQRHLRGIQTYGLYNLRLLCCVTKYGCCEPEQSVSDTSSHIATYKTGPWCAGHSIWIGILRRNF